MSRVFAATRAERETAGVSLKYRPIPFVVVGHVEEPCYDLWSDTSSLLTARTSENKSYDSFRGGVTRQFVGARPLGNDLFGPL